MSTFVLWYIIYAAVTIVLTFVTHRGAAKITGWRAAIIMPAFLPLFLLGWLMGTHKFRRYKNKEGAGVSIELND